MNTLDLGEHLDFMVALAQKVGGVIMEYFDRGDPLEKEWISKTNFSTAADKKVFLGEDLGN